ncbi:tail fiber domain-containing protein [Hymenobacter negativus]
MYSDARVKTDVRADVPGLAFVTRLRPVTYLFDAARLAALIQVPARPRRAEGPAADLTRHTGFLAQDVERVAQELGFDFDGLHRPAHARDPYALGYAQFVVPLVRAVQELNAEVETLKAQNTAMQVQNAALQTQAATDRVAAAAQSAGFAQRLQALEAAGAAASR